MQQTEQQTDTRNLKLRLNVGDLVCWKDTNAEFVTISKALSKNISDEKFSPAWNLLSSITKRRLFSTTT